jgi:hypothetical protein
MPELQHCAWTFLEELLMSISRDVTAIGHDLKKINDNHSNPFEKLQIGACLAEFEAGKILSKMGCSVGSDLQRDAVKTAFSSGSFSFADVAPLYDIDKRI